MAIASDWRAGCGGRAGGVFGGFPVRGVGKGQKVGPMPKVRGLKLSISDHPGAWSDPAEDLVR